MTDNRAVLKVTDLSQVYRSGGHDLAVLQATSFAVQAGETLAIVGPSGSGKTTLLGLCAGLDTPTTGRVELGGKDLAALNEDQRAAVRNARTGFVFQNYQLIPTLTALENVMVPAELQGSRDIATKAHQWLQRVGLRDREDHYPVQLSGGEQQRVALARAFINEPSVLFADEPTGNLDGSTRDAVADLLFALNRDAGTTLVLVTHDLQLAARCQRRLQIERGVVTEVTPELTSHGAS